MLGGGPYTCSTCPSCGENNFWNETRCMSCGYEQDQEEDEQ